MFIKFSDKTKKIMVKRSAEDMVDGYEDESNYLFLDQDSKNNRRIKALSEDEESASEQKKP